jgi:hypothetical protein
VEQRLEAGRSAARQAFVSGAKRPLEDLEQTADTYIQLWLGLARLGISQVAALGERIDAGQIDPARHEILGEEAQRSYVVRSGGLAIEGEVVQRARVEASD